MDTVKELGFEDFFSYFSPTIAFTSVAQWPAKSLQNDFAKYQLALAAGPEELGA